MSRKTRWPIVSMIENASLTSILTTATDVSIVCEIYDADAVPSSDGFDPVDALDCFAAAGGIAFRTRDYKRLVEKFGTIKRTITKEVNNASVTFSNVSREISDFEFTNGFEGLILVVRLLSRSRSTVLTDTQILFTGRCEKPDSGDKDSLVVKAKFVLGSLDVRIPRRKYGPEDHEGRVPSDPEFEGFLFTPQYGTTSYSVRKKAGGILGLFGFKKKVRETLQWSSFSDLDANTPVAEVFGRAQMLGVHIAYEDVGTYLRVRTAFCEGEIQDIQSARSTDSTHPITFTAFLMGLVGSLNGPDDASIPGPGWYSRTAHMRSIIVNSTLADVDPAPDIAAVILGRKMLTPDGTGSWVTTAWSDNAAAHVHFLLTNNHYYKLDSNWIDYDYATTCFQYNAYPILDTSISDFLFVDEG